MIYVGIDVAKNKRDCFITNSEGEVLFKPFTIPNNREGFDALFQRIKSVSDDVAKVKAGLEAAGHYSYNLLGFLLDKGLPHALHVTTANISNKAGAMQTIENSRSSFPCVINILCDGSYMGKSFYDRIRQLIGENVVIIKRNEPRRFEVLPKRWIVERSFGWLGKSRRQ